ncbi:MAG: response regulator [Nitrospirales bacterium]
MAPKVLYIHSKNEPPDWAQRTFDEWGLELVAGANDTDRLERARLSDIVGLLLDLDDLQMDGLTILTNLRHQLLQIPIIVIGSNGTEHLLIQALTKGAQDYLLKPISIDEMHDKCMRLFN